MRCPSCGSQDTQVTDTRLAENGLEIRRRRRCLACERRFKTLEIIQISLPVVVKRNGVRAEFKSKKIRASMSLALRKRPVSLDSVDIAVRHIEETLSSLGDREISSQRLGELVMRELRKIDKVGYVRFASVYRSFEDVSDFQDLLDEVGLKKQRKVKKKRT
ncbi:MAG: transcriptional regulator NrdR [Burkholderiaceae bacterium]|mgnify:FL=1|nr:MAG: transcriptional regulator NrdR [Betaproteobacteria bacterium TMED41]|tara:strand:+ start:345 stop:827 length:483 start_codon:yes stop_codon:yes gene_type:complete